MSNWAAEYQHIDGKKAAEILSDVEKQLANRFSEIYAQKYNQNTKGYDYEKILAEFFSEYLGGAFDFEVRVGVLDIELKAHSSLKAQENEFDVVAIYKNAVPKLVCHKLVPFDSVAFITEAKQSLTISNLKKDLAKFKKISDFKVADNRPPSFSAKQFKKYKLKRPLKVLFYYEDKCKTEKLIQVLEGEFREFWDVCIIFKENLTLLNSTLPFVKGHYKEATFVRLYGNALIKALFFICFSIEGVFVDSWVLFWNLFRSDNTAYFKIKKKNNQNTQLTTTASKLAQD